ncbi:oxygen-independent coproporphyrinogen-3 oxidase [Catalinimonas alkaloidigena]|uniref:radical SAM family heme chaperone HemW n=1 Tax=Catalinimonas alkaloidigena TaxID=1075417 RepID=UPI00240702FD|nr:radical SAM family heme chaperone HemW [Catalinimonas alkaloidigena]MDF9794762.1 oxygen-independent coproporphyrinogen-3 oxidase [Catalinimonas alkaloidigena]
MAGIYIHIPFCKQACHYCDFHFSTNTSRKTEMVQAIIRELQLQKDYLGGELVNTIYFGGGTPSLLSASELSQLLKSLDQLFPITDKAEITLEANPDDLNADKLKILKTAGINRLSIGIQSFHEPHLKFLNRAHNANEASNCVQFAQDVGFDNISIDLIYAIPAKDHAIWESDLAKAIALQVQHISSYCLTIEEKTVFGNWLRKGKLKEVEDNYAAEQFEMLLSTLKTNGYEQYEISNFCLPDFYSRHNSNYWRKEPYLGVGPGAHSYNGQHRQFNISNNNLYLKALTEEKIPAEQDILALHDQINEYIMTGLRTKWGCDLRKIKEEYKYDLYQENKIYLDQLLADGKILMQDQYLILTDSGKLLADRIASDLFIVR